MVAMLEEHRTLAATLPAPTPCQTLRRHLTSLSAFSSSDSALSKSILVSQRLPDLLEPLRDDLEADLARIN